MLAPRECHMNVNVGVHGDGVTEFSLASLCHYFML